MRFIFDLPNKVKSNLIIGIGSDSRIGARIVQIKLLKKKTSSMMIEIAGFSGHRRTGVGALSLLDHNAWCRRRPDGTARVDVFTQ